MKTHASTAAAMLGLMMLTACQGPSSLPEPGKVAPRAISGKLLTSPIPNYLQLTSDSGVGGVSGTDNNTVYTRTRAGLNGSFSLPLPNPSSVPLMDPVVSLSAFGCSGAPDMDDQAALGTLMTKVIGANQTVAAGMIVITPVGSYIAVDGDQPERFLPKVNIRQYGWMYVDRDVNITGKLDCGGMIPGIKTFPVDVALGLKAGWNVVGLSLFAQQGLNLQTQGRLQLADPGSTQWVDPAAFQTNLPQF